MASLREDTYLEFENMPVNLVATRKIPRIETSGTLIEEREANTTFSVNLWIAKELIDAGLASFTDNFLSNEEWTQIHYRERFHPVSQLSPLPDNFYSRVYLTFSKLMSEKGRLAEPENVNRLKGMYRDILESRINKIVRLASAETSIKSGTLESEEDIFYRELHDLIDSWRVRMRKLMVI